MWTLFPCFTKKSHTCEEGGAHLRISFCHLLIFEKPEKSEFWKIKKNLLKISSFYTCVPKTTMIWGTVSEIRSETKCFCHVWPFSVLQPPLPPTIQKIKILKKWKRIWKCHHFKLVRQRHDQMIYIFTQIWGATDIIFCQYKENFCSFTALSKLSYRPWKLKFGKNAQKTWRYCPFTRVHHKSRSYDIWLLRYKVQRTKFFVILGHFLPFDAPNNPKNQNFEKIK